MSRQVPRGGSRGSRRATRSISQVGRHGRPASHTRQALRAVVSLRRVGSVDTGATGSQTRASALCFRGWEALARVRMPAGESRPETESRGCAETNPLGAAALAFAKISKGDPSVYCSHEQYVKCDRGSRRELAQRRRLRPPPPDPLRWCSRWWGGPWCSERRPPRGEPPLRPRPPRLDATRVRSGSSPHQLGSICRIRSRLLRPRRSRSATREIAVPLRPILPVRPVRWV